MSQVQTAGASPVAAVRQGRGNTRILIARYGVYVALALLLVLNIVITRNFLTVPNLRLQLVQTVPVLIVALGMAMVIGTKGIDLSVGSVMAMAAATAPLYMGYGSVAAMGIGVLVGLVSGLVAGFLVAVVRLQPIVATLAIMVGGRGLANVIGGEIKSINDKGFVFIGTGDVLGVPVSVLIGLVLVLVVAFLMRRTVFGLFVEALGGNKRGAELAGVRIRAVLISVYAMCGVLAAVAGLITAARTHASDPKTLGLLMELNAITAVVVGGTSLNGGKVRVLGTVVGALLMQLITATLIAHNIPDSAAQMIQAGVILLAVYTQVGRKRQ